MKKYLFKSLFIFLKFLYVQNTFYDRSKYRYNVEFDTLDKDVFDELAPKGLKYNDIINKLGNKEQKNLTFSIIDQIVEKINATHLNLGLASYFISEHKFRERDWRHFLKSYSISDIYYDSMVLKKGFDNQAKFMISFPEPPLLNLFPDVVEKCEQSAFTCLEYIGEITK